MTILRPGRASRLSTAALVLSVLAALLLAWSLPLIEATALAAGLRETLADGAHLTVERPGVTDFDAFAAFQGDAERRLGRRMAPYLGTATLSATTGPLYPVTIDGTAVSAEASSTQLAAAYLGDLAPHVRLLAGTLPPDGLRGDSVAVSMWQQEADRAGLRLGERFCMDFEPGEPGRQAPFCARISGLWQPLRGRDPYWAGSPPRSQLVMGSYDFFQLMLLHPPQGALAARRYAADLANVDPGRAPDLLRRVNDARASLGADRSMRLTTSFDVALDRFGSGQATLALITGLVTASLVTAALSLVALAAARHLDSQGAAAALLRAYGWAHGRVLGLLALELGRTAVVALPLALVAGLLATAAVAALAAAAGIPAAGPMVSLGGLGQWIVLPAATLAGVALALGAVAALAASTASGSPRLVLEAAWRWRNLDLPIAVTGLLLLLTRPVATAGLHSADTVSGVLRFAPPVLAMALLATVAVRLLSPVARLTSGRRTDVPGTLARLQLTRRPTQHAGLVFHLVVSLAIASFCAAALLGEPRSVSEVALLERGREAALTIGVTAALAMAVAGFGLHFRVLARARREEYGQLAVHGLPAGEVRASIAVEQLTVLAAGVPAGAVLGLAMALVWLPAAGLGGGVTLDWWELAIGLAASILLPSGLLAVAWWVRREGTAGDVFEAARRTG